MQSGWNGPIVPHVAQWLQDLPLWAWLVIIPLLFLFNRDARIWLSNYGRNTLPEDETVTVDPKAVARNKNLRL